MSDITNAMLAQKISDLLSHWSLREREMQEWLTGAPDGGPYADGRFALSDVGGIVRYTKSPSRLEQDVTGLVTTATNASGEVLALHAEVITARNLVVTARDQTSSYLNQAVAARDMAQQHRGYAANSEQNAQSHRNAAAASATAALVDAQTANTKATEASTSAEEAATSAAAAAASAEAAALFDPSSYYTREESDARFRLSSVSITNADIVSLSWSKLIDLPLTFTPSAHTHEDADLASLSWSKLTGVPSSFVPSAHTHADNDLLSISWGKITGVPSTFNPGAHVHGDGDITALAWSKLTGVPSTFTPSAHTHAASDIASGTLADARLSSNVPLKNAGNTFATTQTVDTTQATALVLQRTSNANLSIQFTNSVGSRFLGISTNGDLFTHDTNNLSIGRKLALMTGDTFVADSLGTTNYQMYERNYPCTTAAPAQLLRKDGTAFATTKTYRVRGVVTGTSTHTGAEAIFFREGGAWQIVKLYERGVTSNQIEFFVDAVTGPNVRLWNHTTTYNVQVWHEEFTGAGTNGAAPLGKNGFRDIVNVPYFGNTALSLEGHTHSGFALEGHTHIEYIPKIPQTDTGWDAAADGGVHFLATDVNSPNGTNTYFGVSMGHTVATHAFQLAARNGDYRVRTKENGTWGSWQQLALQGHTHTFGIGDITGLQGALDGKLGNAQSVWISDAAGSQRFYFGAGSRTYYKSPTAGSDWAHEFRRGDDATIAGVRADGWIGVLQGIYNMGGGRSFEFAQASAYTYGSAYLSGAGNGWTGLALNDGGAKATFMASGNTGGIYWQGPGVWSFYDDGTSSSVDRPLHFGTGFTKPYVRVETGGARNGGRITISTATPSGTPTDGDIWIQREA